MYFAGWEPSDGCNFEELIHANANLDDNDYDNGTSILVARGAS